KGKVLSIVVVLEVPLPARDVAEQLRLAGVPVTIDDDAGKAVGMAFPERGAVFRFAPRSPTRVSSERRGKIRKSREIRDDSAAQRVNEIVLGEIDAEPFLLRA